MSDRSQQSNSEVNEVNEKSYTDTEFDDDGTVQLLALSGKLLLCKNVTI